MNTSVDSPVEGGREFRIGDWMLDAGRNELVRDGESHRLEPKVIEVLAYLASRPGKVVAREELLAAVWPGVIVGDDALTQAIIKLRKALGDDAHNPTYIETISKRGYRLIAPVAPKQARPGSKAKVLVALAVTLVSAAIAIPLVGKWLRMPWPIGEDTRGAVNTAMPVVAILPLANLSGDAKREYFSDGMTEDLIGALGRFSGVRVMARNAVQGFKGKAPAPRTVREELGVRYIVQGSLREAEGRWRIAIELSDAEKGVMLWSERFDGEGVQLFEIQDRIAKNIVAMLHVKLTEAERARVFTKPTDSLEAYDLVLRAKALNDPPERRANREARELLARAQKIAPEYADLLTTLGEAELNRARYGWVEDPDLAAARAEELAKRTLALADTRAHPRAHSLLAAIYGYFARFEEALTHTASAIELNPSDSEALYRRGEALLNVGRVEESIAPLESSRRLEPHAVRINLVMAYFLAGRTRAALALADSLLERAPDHVALNAMRAASQAELNNLEEARRSAQAVRRYSPTFEVDRWVRGVRYGPENSERLRAALRKAGL